MTKTLEQQIVKALTADDPPPTLEQLLTLVGEVESAIIEADNEASLAQEQFLDPIATPDANAGRAKMEMTQFTSARLRTLLPRLESRAREVEAEGKHVPIAKAQVHRPQGEQAVSEQGRQRHQDHGECHLRHHQRSP